MYDCILFLNQGVIFFCSYNKLIDKWQLHSLKENEKFFKVKMQTKANKCSTGVLL